jgi:hypothetical protein
MDKKRIRGLKRHLRNHQQWATIQEPFNEERIRKVHYDYAHLGLSPWRVNGKPPVAIRKLWVSRLVANYREWYKQMMVRYDDFYLAVWIFDPTFGESEVVVAIEEKMDGYAERHGEVLELPLPPEYQSLPGVDDLTWTAKEYVTAYTPKGFAEMGRWASRKPHWPTEGDDGEQLVLVQLGVVWVGQIA